MSNVRIGTSGWNYPTGRGTWNGVFYPPPRRRPKGFDELSYYAEHFDTVEVNSTFYGQPREDVCRRWASRTPPGFEFSVKLYQKFTHPEMFKQRLERSLPADARDSPGGVLDGLARPNQTDLDQFRRGVEPLAVSELKEFSETADAARRLVKKLYLYTNNHFSAKSVANAAMIKRQLGEPVDGEYTEEFVARYPELAGVVKSASAGFAIDDLKRSC